MSLLYQSATEAGCVKIGIIACALLLTAPDLHHPPQVFDNHDFEVRSPENWLSLAKDSEGNVVGLPARALFLQPDQTGTWRESKVQHSNRLSVLSCTVFMSEINPLLLSILVWATISRGYKRGAH